MYDRPMVFDIKPAVDDRGIIFVPYDGIRWHFVGQLPGVLDVQEAMPPIQRVYVVRNHAADTIRGMHYHMKEFKVFTAISGAAKFVTCKAAATGKGGLLYMESTRTFTLSHDHPQILIVPPYYANGWKSLSHDTVLLCLSSLTFEESVEDDIRGHPKDLPVPDSFEVVMR